MTPLPVTAIFMIRHGEPEAWAKEVCHGALDVPLSEDGRKQARCIGDRLRGSRIDAVYSSPRSRALATAAEIADPLGLIPVILESLAEIDFGTFEGRTFDEIAVSHPHLYARWMREPEKVRFPGGESFDDLRRRVLPAIVGIRLEHQGGSIAVVTHGGVIRVVLAAVLGVEDHMVFRIGQSWGGMSLVEWNGDDPIVRSVNVTL